jgi:DNA-binding NarL/FixJ family response regulator
MTGARVLIVEDEVIVAEELRRSLMASGYDVIGHAMNGREALQVARRLHPDVVLMDLVLDGPENGIEVARSIQGIIETSIIYVTAQSSESVIAHAARSGAFGYVLKPFQTRQITSSIEIALHRQREVRTLQERARPVDEKSAPEPRFHIGSETGHDGEAGTAKEEDETSFKSIGQRLRALLEDEDAESLLRNGRGEPTIERLCITPREREIVRTLICYRRLPRVADVLGISVHTARNHLKSVFRKLNVHSQDELLRYLRDEIAAAQSD